MFFSRFRHTKNKDQSSLLGRDFILLFFLVLFSNSYLAIYYCFEQWLEHVQVAPSWRGILLGALFGMVMLIRPVASIVLLKANKLPAVILSLIVSSAVLFTYQFLPVSSPLFEWMLLGLRLVQGFCLAIYSSCTVAVLVSCIPPGQSARGFALFSLTALLPYALIPTIGEILLPLVGGEPRLFAVTALLIVPCFVMIFFLADKLRQPEVSGEASTDFAQYRSKVLHSVTHSGLGFVFLCLLCFSLTTSSCIFFIKGLCSQTGGDPASFFFFYTTTIMVVRVFGSTHLDRMPRYRIVPVTAATMGLSLLIIAWGPLGAYIPATLLYGTSLSLLYPLSASVIYNRSTEDTRTVNSNLMMLMFDTAALFSPIIGGAVISAGFDYHAVITVAAITAMLSGVFFLADRLRLHLEELRRNRTA